MYLFSFFIIKQMADAGITTIPEANDLAISMESGCLHVTKKHSGPETVKEADQCNVAKWFGIKSP